MRTSSRIVTMVRSVFIGAISLLGKCGRAAGSACSLSRLRERGGERVGLHRSSCLPPPCPSPASGGGDAVALAVEISFQHARFEVPASASRTIEPYNRLVKRVRPDLVLHNYLEDRP